LEHLAEVGYDEKFGARPLRRAIQTNVEDKLAEGILAGEIKEGDAVKIDYVDNEVILKSI
jgi:ATP-dependent Clp protease ATP-binding subunit ClpC